jgi:two-component system LytT family response regulator
MKAIIVEDEAPARRELRRLLADYPWLEIVGEAGNVVEAATQVERLTPDLIFLDIQMPGGSGFDLLGKLEHVPQVIFTTAHDEHALRAFEVNALDYLLKPIDPKRLSAALARVRRPTATSATHSEPVLEQLFVRDGPRCWFVPLREVCVLTADGNFVRLSWGKLQPMVGRALAAIEERLDPKKFFRANRRQVINLDFVESVELGTGGSLYVQLRDGPEIEISRRQARLFKQQSSV